MGTGGEKKEEAGTKRGDSEQGQYTGKTTVVQGKTEGNKEREKPPKKKRCRPQQRLGGGNEWKDRPREPLHNNKE